VLLVLVLTTLAAAQPLRHDPSRDPVIGVNIWSVYAGGAGVAAWEEQIERIHRMGFGAVTILPQFFVNLATGEVSRQDPTPRPTYGGMSDTELTAAIAKAKSLGLIVTVSPTLEPANRTLFRGEIAFNDSPPKEHNGVDTPDAEARFWSSYTAQIAHFAALAQAAGADRLNIGAELGTLDTDPRNARLWKILIETADEHFTGQLGYTTVHWTFDSPATRAMIYADPKIDYISLSSYFALATEAQAAASGGPGDVEFVRIVQENFTRALKDRILPAAAALKKPVILNEIGITPFDGAAAQPWDWTLGDRAKYDPAEARNVLEGIFRAIADRNEQIVTANLWIWGWPGGFASERFYINDNPADLPDTPFDESQMSLSNEFIKAYLLDDR